MTCYIQSFAVWSDDPVIDTLETTTFPIKQVDFPTVTLCPKTPTPDRWGPVVKVFDHLKVACSNE